MPKILQASRQPSLAAADVDRPMARRRHNFKELIAVEAPIAVVPRRACPPNPLSSMSFPTLTEVHRPTLMPTNAKERADTQSRCVKSRERPGSLLFPPFI